jgi:hypothetical protein
MRTSIALLGVAVVGMVLTGCAAQQATLSSSHTPAITPGEVATRTHVQIEPAVSMASDPLQAAVAVHECDVSHPYYRDAKTLVVGPVHKGELEVQLRRNSPELEQKATLTVVRTAGEHRYYLGDLPLDKRAHLVLSPGCHHLYVLILGEMVPIGEVVLEADVDYLACLGDL